MNSARRHTARTLLMLSTLLACGIAPDTTPQAAPAPADQRRHDELAGIRPEGRLRKLHLVRPDLIPYPIAYEVYC